MGKALIINGADFSQNAVEQINTGSIQQKKSQRYVFFLDYQGTCGIRQSAAQAASTFELLVGDVQNFVGQQIRITSVTPIVSGAFYACFANSLGDLTFNDIPNIGMAPGSTQITHYIVPVGTTFNVSTTDGEVQSVVKTVPTNAKYIIVTGVFGGNLTEENFKVELV